MEKTTAFFIGRFAPPHKGHIQAILKLINNYDEVIIGLGSCYDVGSKRAPLQAIFREKLLLLSIEIAGGDLSKIKIVHIQDYLDFNMWLNDILEICNIYKVTHFITGNHEDILDILKDKKIDLPFVFINPESSSDYSYHASDLRKAICKGDYEKYKEIAALGTELLLSSFDGFNRIKVCSENKGRTFYQGAQSVDVVFTIQEKVYSSKKPYIKNYVLCGKRDGTKIDFPNTMGLVGGIINKYESPIDAIIRNLNVKAGIKCKLISNTCEPALVSIETDIGNYIGELGFLFLYNDKDLAGKNGGSSQAFYLNIYGDLNMFKINKPKDPYLFMSVEEALNLEFGFQHKEMLKDAVARLERYAE